MAPQDTPGRVAGPRHTGWRALASCAPGALSLGQLVHFHMQPKVRTAARGSVHRDGLLQVIVCWGLIFCRTLRARLSPFSSHVSQTVTRRRGFSFCSLALMVCQNHGLEQEELASATTCL